MMLAMTTAVPSPKAAMLRRLLAVIALGIALGGCAKCQDWRLFGAGAASLDTCKSDTPPAQ
jgi:hypothetical protein